MTLQNIDIDVIHEGKSMSDLSDPADQKQSSATTEKSQETKPEHVPYSTYRELLDEKKKTQAAKLAAEARAQELEEKERLREEEALKKKGDFETILKLEREKNAKLVESLSAREKRDLELAKARAFVKAAGGDIDSRFLEHGLIPIDSIIVDPSTGEIDQMSVAKAVDSFKQVWPEALKKPGVKLPTDAPNGGSKISRSEWLKLAPKEMLKWKSDQISE